jgi:hypothetical protein
MTYSLDAFVKDAKSALETTGGPAGREKVRVLLEKLLGNQAFVEEAVGPAAPSGTRKLYEDKDLGFVVLAHCNPSRTRARRTITAARGRSMARRSSTPT